MLAQESFKDLQQSRCREGKTAVILIMAATSYRKTARTYRRTCSTLKLEMQAGFKLFWQDIEAEIQTASQSPLQSRIFAPRNLSPLSPGNAWVIEFRYLKAKFSRQTTDEALQTIYNQTSMFPDVLSLCQFVGSISQEGVVKFGRMRVRQ